MVNFKIVIPGTCPVKKNTMTLSYWQNTKGGGKIPRQTPIPIYSEPYKKWAKQAINVLGVFKNNLFVNNWKLSNGTELKLPLNEPLVMTAVFFRPDNKIVDVSNLIETPQDVLIGKPGSFMDTHKVVHGEKITTHYNHDSYKIIADDNRFVIRNLGGSTVIYDPVSPRTEIFISSFDLSKWKQVMDIWHPGLEIGNSLPTEQLTLDLGSPYENLFI